MNKTGRARLEAQGWKVGTAAAFLELSPEEAAFVDTRLAPSHISQSIIRFKRKSSAPIRLWPFTVISAKRKGKPRHPGQPWGQPA